MEPLTSSMTLWSICAPVCGSVPLTLRSSVRTCSRCRHFLNLRSSVRTCSRCRHFLNLRSSVRTCSRCRHLCAHVPSLSALPRLSPALAAAEGRHSTRSILPSRPRLVATSSLYECKPGQNLGGQWPMCASPAPRLLWCAPVSERGAVQQ